ncbi:hypothetical protein Poly30_00270 [Planctomycetes bacterium Poly30]|uniref:Cytochrome c domain-containing protein n=1 Tax=Saltatorellus ferox TaxID=2528018 RepID=A0A518EKC4_9BACT|nr:hypothetical protein Poly30_00270 [Planctomycetes bacterium Poly30]
MSSFHARRALVLFTVLGSLGAVLAPQATAQYAERGALVGSGAPDVDASGRSVKNPRVRAIHSEDPGDEGATAYLLQRDPFLGYQLGRNLNLREFRHRDGAVLTNVGGLAGPMLDGTTAKITANNQLSCAGCHNLPNGNAGGGANFSKDSGFGRNTPHYFGAGVMEMLALQTRQKLLNQVDHDGDGWVSAREALHGPDRATIQNVPGAAPIDHGTFRLSGGSIGVPGLNPIYRIWYGAADAEGTVRQVPGATSVDGRVATHYGFEMVVWGWGQRTPQSALNPTNRAFVWDPMLTHTNLESFDPSTDDDPDGDGVSVPTLAGAVQFPATHRAPDRGASRHSLGFSLDDPDGDGHLNEISEGDLDLAEWFMLNAPRPAFAGTYGQYREGLALLEAARCTSCHVADWQIDAADGVLAGDRRLFDLDVRWNGSTGRLEGRMERLYDLNGELHVPRRSSARIQGLFTDFRHHDMGPAFTEAAFDGNRNRLWRTAPLWGVGSGFPWGHDGRSLTLDDVIRRHGGEAAASTAAYLALDSADREKLVSFLGKLVLYDVESLPADIDGDGQIAKNFMVQGEDTGPERFNAEWLFATPVQIQGLMVNLEGELFRSHAAVNLTDAYGLNLPFRKDSDLDGWPDVWDEAPMQRGYRDGIRD